MLFWLVADLPGKNLSSTSLNVGFLKIVLDWLLVGTCSFNSLFPAVSSIEFDFLSTEGADLLLAGGLFPRRLLPHAS